MISRVSMVFSGCFPGFWSFLGFGYLLGMGFCHPTVLSIFQLCWKAVLATLGVA